MEKTRRQFTPQPKVAVLREHLVEHVPGSDPAYLHDARSRHRGGEPLEYLPGAQGRRVAGLLEAEALA